MLKLLSKVILCLNTKVNTIPLSLLKLKMNHLQPYQIRRINHLSYFMLFLSYDQNIERQLEIEMQKIEK